MFEGIAIDLNKIDYGLDSENSSGVSTYYESKIHPTGQLIKTVSPVSAVDHHLVYTVQGQARPQLMPNEDMVITEEIDRSLWAALDSSTEEVEGPILDF